jgi:hypothetical protein
MRFSVVFTIIICVVLAVSAIVYLRQPEPEVISPSSTPELSKSSPQVDTPTSPSTDSTKEEAQAPDDLQNDVEFDKQAQIPLDDPLAPFRSQDTEAEDEETEGEETADEKEETKIDPRTIDFGSPDAYEFLRQSLVMKYGDTPEVQAYMEAWLKNVSGPTTLEDDIRLSEATYALNPHPENYRSLQISKAAAAGDSDTLMRYAEPVNHQTEKFADVLPFFEKNSHAEAFRKLRTADTKRAIEFEKFIMEQVLEDPSLDIEKIVRSIERSYETTLDNK